MEKQQNILSSIFRLTATMIVVCGLAYPAVVTGVAQVTMPNKAEGSLIYNDKKEVIGSELIGQNFQNPKYFHGRVSSIDYKAEGSGSNNFAPSNPDLLKRTEETVQKWKEENPTVLVSKVPIDLVTNAASGLDPHISPEAAYVQIDRISKMTSISKDELEDLVKVYTEGPELGLFGEERVNVLKLNVALQQMM